MGGARAPGVSGLNTQKKEKKRGKGGRKKEKGRREGSDRDDLNKTACRSKILRVIYR